VVRLDKLKSGYEIGLAFTQISRKDRARLAKYSKGWKKGGKKGRK